MANSSVYNTTAANTPAIVVGDGSTGVTVLASNPARIGFSIQNVGTTAAFIRIAGFNGTGQASATVYHYALKGGTADNDGLGASITLNTGAIPTGLITMYGASTAKVTALEIAP